MNTQTSPLPGKNRIGWLMTIACLFLLFNSRLLADTFTTSGHIDAWDVFDGDGNYIETDATTDVYWVSTPGGNYVSASSSANASVSPIGGPWDYSGNFAIGM